MNATVTLSSGPSPAEPATGAVTFKDGGTTLNTAVVNLAGDAGYAPHGFQCWIALCTASYSGDASYNASTSAAVTFSISQATPSIFIAVPENPYTQGQASALTILVEGGSRRPAPTGSVTLTGVPAGTSSTATLSAGVDPVSGNTVGLASVAIPSTAAGKLHHRRHLQPRQQFFRELHHGVHERLRSQDQRCIRNRNNHHRQRFLRNHLANRGGYRFR